MAPSLADTASELYSLVPQEFTAARDAAARAARSDGDRKLADEIKGLRRPPVGAWLVNQLVRRHASEIDALLDLGAELREAQEALDSAQLRTMTRRRQEVIRELSELAASLAADTGQQVGDAAQREVEATLDAALADAEAAEAVRTGRLMRALSSTGLAAVDLSGAVAAPHVAAPPRRPGKARKATPAPKKDRSDGRAARHKAATDARTAFERAEEELAERERSLGAARSAVDDVRARINKLQTALDEAAAQRTEAEHARRDAEAARKDAARSRDAAKRALDSAERARSRG